MEMKIKSQRRWDTTPVRMVTVQKAKVDVERSVQSL